MAYFMFYVIWISYLIMAFFANRILTVYKEQYLARSGPNIKEGKAWKWCSMAISLFLMICVLPDTPMVLRSLTLPFLCLLSIPIYLSTPNLGSVRTANLVFFLKICSGPFLIVTKVYGSFLVYRMTRFVKTSKRHSKK